MVNDTTTLNGALAELGETMAANITTKGVSASASDGLTTLVGKILQISGDTPTPTTVIFEDYASTDNSSTLFGSTIPLRNNGTGRVDYVSTSPNHYAIVNTTNQAEAFLPYSLLNGVTDSFKITVKSKNNSSATCPIGLYYYIDSNNWGGVKDETTNLWVSDKTSGTFSEQSYSTGLSYSPTVITEITFDSDLNTLEINQYDENNVLKKTATMTIPVTLTSSVKWGSSITWSSNATRNVYEIKAEYLGTPSPSSDCSQYTTQINNAITYINGSGN